MDNAFIYSSSPMPPCFAVPGRMPFLSGHLSAANDRGSLVSHSDICQLATSLRRGARPVGIISYRSASIRAGAAMLRAGLVRMRWAAQK
jgi:hypothetical protein